MNLFPKFDPRSVSLEPAPTPAKPAKVAKVVTQTPQNTKTLAALATLAGVDVDSTEFEERAAIVEYDGKIPKKWAEGLALLDTMPRPASIPESRWRQAVDNAGRFADRWAAQASALGWNAYDIFGVDRHRPEAAIHTSGLIWLLQDKRIIAIAADMVIVEMPNGARQTFIPRADNCDDGRRVLLWELGEG